jgi:hypothetical protein
LLQQFVEAARKDLHESFNGRRAPLLSTSRVAVEAGAAMCQIVGAALLSKDKEYAPAVTRLDVRHLNAYQHPL